MVIGMLGGSFCPPTIAHLELSKRCIETGLCDKVVWVPVNEAYRKNTNIASKHRVEMVKLALQNETNITYSLHEQKHKDIVRTYESIQELQTLYPNGKIVFIAGADKMAFKWFQKEAFVRDFGYIVTNRGDIDCEALIANSPTLSRWRNHIHILNYNSSVSSTEAREEIQESRSTQLVDSKVMDYINKHNLFLGGD